MPSSSTLFFLLFFVMSCRARGQQDLELLFAALTALFNGLQYMQDHVEEINLDGAFGCRCVSELLQDFAESRPDLFAGRKYVIKEELAMLSGKANEIVYEAQSYLKIDDPVYFEALGKMVDEIDANVWHPGRVTNPTLRVPPRNASRFDGALSDGCLRETFCSRGTDEKNKCQLSMRCLQTSTRLEETDYVITHQILFLQFAEMRNCFSQCEVMVSENLKDALCSNVMRDAENIAKMGFPQHFQDLFMEQVGVCGLWGYKDFYRREWLRNILQWQEFSGCYKSEDLSTYEFPEVNNRVKRTEKILKDGCLSHKTSVALIALATSVVFSLEEQH